MRFESVASSLDGRWSRRRKSFKEFDNSTNVCYVGRELERVLRMELERRPADLLPDYRLDWSDASVEWTLAPEQHSNEAEIVARPVLNGDKEVLFEIVAPAPHLDSLSLRFRMYDRRNKLSLRCELLDAGGQLLLSSDHEPESIHENQHQVALNLRSLQFSVGRKYWVRLTSPGASLSDCFGVMARRVEMGRYVLPARAKRFRGDRLFASRDRDLSRGNKHQLACFAVVATGADLRALRRALELLDRAFPGNHFTVLDLGPEEELGRVWPRLAGADVVAFCDTHVANPEGDIGYDAMCFELNRLGVCTVFVDSADLGFEGDEATFAYADGLRDLLKRRAADRRICRFVLQVDAPQLIDNDHIDLDVRTEIGAGTPGALSGLVAHVQSNRMPHVALVSVLYKKAEVIERFIEHVVEQTYPGSIELILVDDKSPEADAERARIFSQNLAARPIENRTIRIIENEENLGNCASRLVGISSAEADIYIVIDCDCLINRDFVAAHVFEHGRRDVDAVIGPLNIESWDRDPVELVRQLEEDRSKIRQESSLQDAVQPNGFVNCITRNFSVKRRLVNPEPLFDEDFGYSTKANSGFGWEDVEMGYRLYSRGSVIGFTERAFSVHVSHESSIAEPRKIRGSFQNFERLFDKHPEMALAARRWAVDTYEKLLAWAKDFDVDVLEAQRSLECLFGEAAEAQRPLTLSYRPGSRRLRILTYRWHVPHQYELYKLPHDFTLTTHSGDNGMVNAWSYDQRPLRENVRLVPAKQIDPTEFDLAILHFDENILSPSLCNNVIPACWGDALDWLIGIPELPKVAICHGTPQFEGQYALNPAQLSSFDVYEDERTRLVGHLAAANVKVVCNSWQALKEWGFHDSRVIWHGFDPQEFPAGTQTLEILALAADRHRPHYRGAWEHAAVQKRLDPNLNIETAEHYGATLEKRGTNQYAIRHFRSYVDRIRQFTAYLNTTLRSPMPRSRGEAMMTGVIPVALANHDVELFIESGKNGFYSDDPLELADWLNHLFRHPAEALRIAAAARRTALDIFNHDRYLTAWTRLIEDALGERIRVACDVSKTTESAPARAA